MDAMLVEKDKRLAEKEDYIIHLQMGIGGEKAVQAVEQITPESKARSFISSHQQLIINYHVTNKIPSTKVSVFPILYSGVSYNKTLVKCGKSSILQ